MTDTKRMDPPTRFVRSLDGEYFMLREAAEMVGISSQALRKTVHDSSLNAPSYWVKFGKLKIYLYTRADIEEIRAWLKKREEVFRTGEGHQPKVGRPRKYTDEQRAEKQREYAKSYYWRKQLKKGEETNNDELIMKAKAKLYELNEEHSHDEPTEEETVVHAVVQPTFIEQGTYVHDEGTEITITAHREPTPADA